MVPTVTLRPLRESDAEELHAAVRESMEEVSRWMVWCHPRYSVDDATAWIRTTIAGRASGACHEFCITDDSGRIVGGCGINHVNSADRFANLGYWVRSTCTGRGYASGAARAAIQWAFRHTTLNRLEIVVAVDNVPSQRVAQRVGAVREGILRQRVMVRSGPADAIMHSVVRSDLQDARA